MPEIDFLRTFIEGRPARHVRLAAARRLVPLPPAQMLALLVHLLGDPEPEVSASARDSLAGVPEQELLLALGSRDCPSAVLEHFSVPGGSSAVLEAIVLNPATPHSAVARIATHAPADTLLLILYNRVRLLEHPEIMQCVRCNPSLNSEVERTLREIEQEFFGEKKQEYTVAAEQAPAEAVPQADETEAVLALEDLLLEGLPVEPAAREKALNQRLASLSIPQKTRLALLGNREARAILIRDPNKQVARAVLKSPKVSEAEIESFASMRNVSEDILRDIGTSKEWTRSYGVVHSLIRNPKTPPLISQRMMFRLMTKDLTNLVRDKGVPELVRRTAQHVLSQRGPGKAG